MLLEVQKLFNSCTIHPEAGHVSFLTALHDIGVDVRDYPEYKMWLLDYNQIECVKNHPVVNECRGLLMAYDGSIVRKGFGRFYNLGENGVDTFDFANSIAFEKADGSLMFVYYCPQTGKWEIGTRGTAFAEGPNEWHGTFRNFMLNAMGRTEAEFQEDCERRLMKHFTYLFEAVGPDNRIVTKYDFNQVIFLSCVDLKTFTEHDCAVLMFEGWNVRRIKHYAFATQEDCMKALSELTGLQEGYVVYNKLTGERVKVKSPTYLAAHRLRGQNGLTTNSICELVVMNEQDEYLAVFPEDAHKFEEAQAMFAYMLGELCGNYLKNKDIETQKDFALAVKDLPLSAVMFKARKSNVQTVQDVHAEFNQFPVSKRAEWLKERLPAKVAPSQEKRVIFVDVEVNMG